jgi:hypothetical protein
MSNYQVEKSRTYRILKNLGVEIRWQTSLAEMRRVLRENRTVFAGLITDAAASRTPITFPYITRNGNRTYFVNNVNEETRNIGRIMFEVIGRVNHALRTGFTEGADVNIRLVLQNDGISTSKNFNSFLIRDSQTFARMMEAYVEMTNSQHANYTYMVSKIVITIIPENSGGCNSSSHDKKTKIGNIKLIAKRSKDNNCLFACLQTQIDIGSHKGKALGKRRNEIRKEFLLEKNTPIPISVAIKIFNKYRTENSELRITDMETKRVYGESEGLHIALQDGHYFIVELNPLFKCKKCLKTYRKKHTCNANKVGFVQSKILKNGRALICKSKKESHNNQNDVIHYDLETFRKDTSGTEVHTPYIVGFNVGEKFEVFAGEDCMIKFVDMLIRLKGKHFINAFNGANFDHYFIYKEFIRRGIKPDKYIINNGSIIKFSFKTAYGIIELFDLCKHLTGCLSDNLKSFDCKILKGDFDHELATTWETMSSTLRSSCLRYLEADVMGLKELFEKLNTDIFNTHKYNLTSYISTSSLSFNLWKENISGKHYIKLPTLPEESAFRQSVRGGRTYKSKHRFKSKQYDAFVNGECQFEDIDDYIIDADVVSLYPTAMAKYEFPVGECRRTSHISGKMGIYKIAYEGNKNLQHSVGGRRDDKGALKWDLKASEGWYTSVDIEDMIENGYTINVIDGYCWDETAFIFKDYIENMFKQKQNSKKGTVKYSLAKLFMNSLYGKMIQRPIYTVTKIITSNSEYWKFWGDNIITGVEMIGCNWEVTGVPREIDRCEKSITKPTHLGSFILAYSRRIMLNYMKESNPHFIHPQANKRCIDDFFYTDTDSLQMHQTSAKKIASLGNKQLGGITDDLGENCKILKGIWIAPKLYMLEYIMGRPGRPQDRKIHYHFRGKGLNTSALTKSSFEKMDEGKSLTNVRAFQMKKIHMKRNSKQGHLTQFSIIHLKDIKKEVNLTPWNGRDFTGNISICR